MTPGKKTGKTAVGSKRLQRNSSVDSFAPRMHTGGDARARAEKRKLPLKIDEPLKAKKPKQFRPKWDHSQEGKYGEHTIFVLPGGIHDLAAVIDQKSSELTRLNLESNGIHKQGSVNLFEDSGLRQIEHQRAILEQLLAHLLQIKKRAYEIPPHLVGKLQVYVEEIKSCAADLIKRRNHEIIQLSPEKAKGHVCLGNRITVEFLETGKKKTCLIGSYYTNGIGEKDEISYASRLAQAAMGASIDSICEMEYGSGTNTETQEFRILKIS